MAIVLDTTSTGNSGGGITSYTLSHTCTGSNLFLVVGIYWLDAGTHDSDSISSVTYGGAAMTQAVTGVNSTNYRLYLYYLINPAVGANNIVATVGGGNNGQIRLRNASYTVVKQGNQPDATSAIQNNTNTVTLNITTVVANCWQVGMVSGTSLVASTGATQRTSDGSQGLFDSNGPLSAGAHSMTITGTGGIYGLSLSVAPAVTQTVSVSDSSSMTEKALSRSRSYSDLITMVTVATNSFTDSVTSSDTYLNVRKGWKNLVKNVSSWIRQNKN